ncbi:MAG: AMP-binding protein, partial [Pseudomonadales bacterium]
MNIAQWLWSSAHSSPNAPALYTGERLDANYAGFANGAADVAALLAEEGLASGDTVVIAMANSSDYLALLYGIWWMGCVAVPVNAKLHAREIAWIATNAEAALIFADPGIRSGLDVKGVDCPIRSDLAFLGKAFKRSQLPACRPRETDSEALAWLFYTSGTTGRPKGAMLSHANLQQMSLCYPTDVESLGVGDGALYAAPMSHGSGLYSIIFTRQGARHITPQSRGFDAAEVLSLARAMGPVSFFAVPTMVARLVDEASKRSEAGEGIKTIVYGGGPMYLADIERALGVFGDRFVQIYGQGESPMTITALGRSEHRLGTDRLQSVGRAQSVVEVRIMGADGTPALPGEIGEIQVRGPTVMMGYWRNQEATDAAIDAGWLLTGDLGRLDDHGYLTLSDRSKDVIISGGSNIYPREVEEVLLTYPGIKEAAVIGLPDSQWGEVVVACLATEADVPSAAELGAHCERFIARFKRPKHYVFLDTLPKSGYGKILRRVAKYSA